MTKSELGQQALDLVLEGDDLGLELGALDNSHGSSDDWARHITGTAKSWWTEEVTV